MLMYSTAGTALNHLTKRMLITRSRAYAPRDYTHQKHLIWISTCLLIVY